MPPEQSGAAGTSAKKLIVGGAALLGGAAAWPVAAGAQQTRIAVVGLINGVSFEGAVAPYVDEIRIGLKEAGFVEGQSVTIGYRSADGHPERLPGLAADLVRRQVAVILIIVGTSPASVAKAATSTIPIVFTRHLGPRRNDGRVVVGRHLGLRLVDARLGNARLQVVGDQQPPR